jgi:hypothetical protein
MASAAAPVVPPTPGTPGTPPVTTPPASAPPSRPSSPSPSRTSLRALTRMGSVFRRNSSSSGFPFPGRLPRSDSKGSLRKEAMTQATPSETPALPSPVAESPVREAAAIAAEAGSPPGLPVHQRSPLSHEAEDSPSPSPTTTAPPNLLTAASEVVQPVPAAETATAPVQEPTAAPAAPAAVPVAAAPPAEQPPQPAASKQAEFVSPRTEDVHVISPSQAAEEQPTVPMMPATVPGTPAPALVLYERGADYFAWKDDLKPKKKASGISLDAHEEPPTRAPAPPPATVAPAPVATAPVPAPPPAVIPVAEASPPHVDPYAASAADSSAWHAEIEAPAAPEQRPAAVVRPATSNEQLVGSPEQLSPRVSRSPSREAPNASPPSMPRSLSPKNSRSSLASSVSYGQVVNVSAGGRRVSVSLDPSPEPRRGRSRSKGSIR